MKIRAKAFLAISLSSVLIILLNLSILKDLIINYIGKQEINTITQNYQRIITMLHKENNTLESTALDWSQWDDTYKFITDGNKTYIKTDIDGTTLKTLNLNFMFFLKNNGKIVYSKEESLENTQYLPSAESILKKIYGQNSNLFGKESLKPATGLFTISGKTAIFSISPVTTSDGHSSRNGVLIIGRYIDKSFISYLEEVLKVRIKFNNIKNAQYLNLVLKNYEKVDSKKGTIWIKKDNNTIKSYTILRSAYNKPEILLHFASKRTMYKDGMLAAAYFSIIFLIGLFIVTSITLILIEKIMTHPLRTLHKFLRTVRENKDTSARIYLKGKDEISELAFLINQVLNALHVSYSDISIMEERFRLIMEATNDGYFDANIKEDHIYVSPAWLKYNGYGEDIRLVNFGDIMNLIHPEDRERLNTGIDACVDKKTENLAIECRLKRKSGQWIWIAIRGKVVEFDEYGNPQRFIGTTSDIDARKKYEAEIMYISHTDPVTSLSNRICFEDIVRNYNINEHDSTWIIMGDLNGLKLINDSFGHHEGDRLLKTVGQVLKKCCSDDDIPIRWGGDEFIILIKDKDAAYAENLIERIKEEFDKPNSLPIKISIAFGKAHSDKEHSDIDSILKVAEKRMYRNKLLESQSARSSTLFSLVQSLHEKHIETEEHTKRITEMCIQIGHKMGLTREELDELALLGMLHDIGKIAIPESVLLKPDKLTDKEWKVMKSHTEIGYRIAASAPELAHIANEILSHHERYDGTGYPHGLKGEEIPKLSRLLTIIDSFDVMTHDRHYKKAMEIEAAIEELKICSGKQFDPVMTESFIKYIEEKYKKS